MNQEKEVGESNARETLVQTIEKELRQLYRYSAPLTDEEWRSDAERLADAIEGEVDRDPRS